MHRLTNQTKKTATLRSFFFCAAVALGMTASRAAFATCTFKPSTGNCNTSDGEYWGGDFHTCVGYNGAEQTGDAWPHDLIGNLWSHCAASSCDGQSLQLWQTNPAGDITVQLPNHHGFWWCDGGLGDTLIVMGRVTGQYCGWDDRNNFINEAQATQGGQAGSWSGGPFVGSWYMPTNLWMRNYQDGGWMNMEFHTICTTNAAVVGGQVFDAIQSLDWLGILALIFFIK
jgi:hypothetical protein